MASTALITAPRNALSSNDATPLMVVPPGEQTASFMAPGWVSFGQIQRTHAFHHLRGQTVGGGALQTILHARIAKRLDVHVGEGRRTAGNAHADAHMRGIDAFDEADRREQPLEHLRLSGGQRVVGFRDEHAFADGHRRVRNGALDVHRAEIGAEQFTVFGEIRSLPQWIRRMCFRWRARRRLV